MKKLFSGKLWLWVKEGDVRYSYKKEGEGKVLCSTRTGDKALIEALGLEEVGEVCEKCGRPPCSECEIYREAAEEQEPKMSVSSSASPFFCGILSASTRDIGEQIVLEGVQQKGRDKWFRGMACENMGAAKKWWDEEGKQPCSYCYYYIEEVLSGGFINRREQTGKSCNCALGGTIDYCVKEWRYARDAINNDNFPAFMLAAKVMYNLIVRTPMIPRKEKL